MPQTFTYKPPVTQSINNLADTLGTLLDARNQRLASEQKAQMDAIKEGYDTFEKTVNVLKIPNLPNNIYESAVDLHNQKAIALKKFGVNINPLPKGVDYNNDDAYKTVVKQLQALPKALESGAIGFTQMPDALNTITQDYLSGANDKKRASVEKMIKDIQKDESGKQFGTFANVMSDPSSMGKTPEDQNSIVTQMVANLRAGDREAATDLWRIWEDTQRRKATLAEMSRKEERQGIDADSGYLLNGEPVLRNTRTHKYYAGTVEARSLEELEKKTKGYAYKKEGLKPKEEEALAGTVKSFDMFNDMESTLSKVSTGFPKVGEAKTALKRYLSDEEFIRFNTARDQLRMLSQDIIKGIPSNFDVENFIKTLPSADYTYAENVSRINKSKKMLSVGFKSKIQNLKKARMPIPDSVMEAAETLGVFSNQTINPNEMQIGGFKVRIKQ